MDKEKKYEWCPEHRRETQQINGKCKWCDTTPIGEMDSTQRQIIILDDNITIIQKQIEKDKETIELVESKSFDNIKKEIMDLNARLNELRSIIRRSSSIERIIRRANLNVKRNESELNKLLYQKNLLNLKESSNQPSKE